MNKYYYDPLFYLIILDTILTLIIVNYGFGYEINPIILKIGFIPGLIISLLIYLFFVPKNIPDDIILGSFDNKGVLKYEIRFMLICYYLFLNIRHFGIIFSGH